MDLADRMKTYETDTIYGSDLPVIIRIDGKAFHTYTKRVNCKKPYDERLQTVMMNTAREVLKEIGANVAYCQSDEVTFLLYNDRPESEIYFNGRKGKLESVVASMFTYYFHYFMNEKYPAFFDARCYQVPNIVEAANAFTWRYLDCIRNSISALAQSHFSHKALMGRSQYDMIEMLAEVDPWDQQLGRYKYGMFIRKHSQGWIKDFHKMDINGRIMYLNGVYV